MIMRSAPVYTSSVGLLDEVRERGRTGPDRVWDLFHALAIRVHARVEIYSSSTFQKISGPHLQSVYMRELKSPMKNMQDLIISILQSVYMRELKSR